MHPEHRTIPGPDGPPAGTATLPGVGDSLTAPDPGPVPVAGKAGAGSTAPTRGRARSLSARVSALSAATSALSAGARALSAHTRGLTARTHGLTAHTRGLTTRTRGLGTRARALSGEIARRVPFRLPAASDPAPPTSRIVLVSCWAWLLTLVGTAVGARAFVGVLFTPAVPAWFQPALIAAGVAGTGLTAGALAAIQHRRLPWLLLPAATGAVGLALLLTVAAL